MYGSKYYDDLLDTLRKSAELCDCLQSFFVVHSMGGGKAVAWSCDYHVTIVPCTVFGIQPVYGIGTGSGIGTKILEILKDEFPTVYRYYQQTSTCPWKHRVM